MNESANARVSGVGAREDEAAPTWQRVSLALPSGAGNAERRIDAWHCVAGGADRLYECDGEGWIDALLHRPPFDADGSGHRVEVRINAGYSHTTWAIYRHRGDGEGAWIGAGLWAGGYATGHGLAVTHFRPEPVSEEERRLMHRRAVLEQVLVMTEATVREGATESAPDKILDKLIDDALVSAALETRADVGQALAVGVVVDVLVRTGLGQSEAMELIEDGLERGAIAPTRRADGWAITRRQFASG